ncbi:hypothetical protein SUGI_0524100 [Cryptomeria japonica]|nr:hypothetical protein SUGI_0524100 [Cryptomeria japonica]
MWRLMVGIKRKLLQLQLWRKPCRIADESALPLPPPADHAAPFNETLRRPRNCIFLVLTRANCFSVQHSDEMEEYYPAPASLWFTGDHSAVVERNYLMVQTSMRYAIFI